MTDRIEKFVEIAAPVDRVWRALTDHREFGAWFRVALDQPFEQGTLSTGRITAPGYEHVAWNAEIVVIEPMHRFAYRWKPYAIDPNRDYSDEPTTLVEFTLAPAGQGTRLTVVESGFQALPDDRREEALRSNTGGWEAQMANIEAYVAT
jgi:uncharacterized protein YndB with AHSA1/START domain